MVVRCSRMSNKSIISGEQQKERTKGLIMSSWRSATTRMISADSRLPVKQAGSYSDFSSCRKSKKWPLRDCSSRPVTFSVKPETQEQILMQVFMPNWEPATRARKSSFAYSSAVLSSCLLIILGSMFRPSSCSKVCRIDTWSPKQRQGRWSSPNEARRSMTLVSSAKPCNVLQSASEPNRILTLKQMSCFSKSLETQVRDYGSMQQIAKAVISGCLSLSTRQRSLMPKDRSSSMESTSDRFLLVCSSKMRMQSLHFWFWGRARIQASSFRILFLHLVCIPIIIWTGPGSSVLGGSPVLGSDQSIRTHTIDYFNNMLSQEEERTIDLSVLEDFEMSVKEDWVSWQVPESKHIPLSFSNRYHFYKNIKFAQLNAREDGKHEQAEFMVVENKIKIKDKQHISKDANIFERRNEGNPFRRQYTKKAQRFFRPYVNQMKTNFKKITVKKDWQEIKNITKNILENLPKATHCHKQELRTTGKVRQINHQVERVSWTPLRFKENQVYEIKPVNTEDDGLMTIGSYYNELPNYQRHAVLCCPEFLLTLLTVRGGTYPWNIEIEKAGNIMAISSYKNVNEANQLSYLDLFLANETTNKDMPTDQNKVKEICITATKLTKVFQDLIASGDIANVDKPPDLEVFAAPPDDEQDEDQEKDSEEEHEQQQEDQERLKKYLKLSVGEFDIFTYVHVDAVKKNKQTGEYVPYLSRIFMEAETQGLWINEMRHSPGSIITKEYQSNGCSLQKWICEARLAGVEKIKLGNMGFEHNKPVLLNVSEIAVDSLEKTLSYSIEFGWSFVNYILSLVSKQGDGKYVLVKAPYVPQMKLYNISKKEDEDDEDESEGKLEEH